MHTNTRHDASSSHGSSMTSSSNFGRGGSHVYSLERNILPLVHSFLYRYPFLFSCLGLFIELMQCWAFALNTHNPGHYMTWAVIYSFQMPFWDGTIIPSGFSFAIFNIFYWMIVCLLFVTLAALVFGFWRAHWVMHNLVENGFCHVVNFMLTIFFIPIIQTLLSGFVCQQREQQSAIEKTAVNVNQTVAFEPHILFFPQTPCTAKIVTVNMSISILLLILWGCASFGLNMMLIPVDHEDACIRRRFNSVMDAFMFIYKVGLCVTFFLTNAYNALGTGALIVSLMSFLAAVLYSFYLVHYLEWVNRLCAVAYTIIGWSGMTVYIVYRSSSDSIVEQGGMYVILVVGCILLGAVAFFLSGIRYDSRTKHLFKHAIGENFVPVGENPFAVACMQQNFELLPFPHRLPHTDSRFSSFHNVTLAVLEEGLREEATLMMRNDGGADTAAQQMQYDLHAAHTQNDDTDKGPDAKRTTEQILMEEAVRRQVVCPTISVAWVPTDAEVSVRFLNDWQNTTETFPTPYMVSFASRIFNRFLLKYQRTGMVIVAYISFLCDYAPSLTRMTLCLELIRSSTAGLNLTITERFLFFYYGLHVRETLGIRNAIHHALASQIRQKHQDVLLRTTLVWRNLLEESRSPISLYWFTNRLAMARWNCFNDYVNALYAINDDEAFVRSVGLFMREVYSFKYAGQICELVADTLARLQVMRLQRTFQNTARLETDEVLNEASDAADPQKTMARRQAEQEEERARQEEEEASLNGAGSSASRGSSRLSSTIASSGTRVSSVVTSEGRSSQSKARNSKKMAIQMMEKIMMTIDKGYKDLLAHLHWELLTVSSVLSTLLIMTVIALNGIVLITQLSDWARLRSVTQLLSNSRSFMTMILTQIYKTSFLLPNDSDIGLSAEETANLKSNVTYLVALINTADAAHSEIFYGPGKVRYSALQNRLTEPYNLEHIYTSGVTFDEIRVSYLTQVPSILAGARRIAETLSEKPTYDSFVRSTDVLMITDNVLVSFASSNNELDSFMTATAGTFAVVSIIVFCVCIVASTLLIAGAAYMLMWNYRRASSIIAKELQLFEIIPRDSIRRIATDAQTRLDTFIYLNRNERHLLASILDEDEVDPNRNITSTDLVNNFAHHPQQSQQQQLQPSQQSQQQQQLLAGGGVAGGVGVGAGSAMPSSKLLSHLIEHGGVETDDAPRTTGLHDSSAVVTNLGLDLSHSGQAILKASLLKSPKSFDSSAVVGTLTSLTSSQASATPGSNPFVFPLASASPSNSLGSGGDPRLSRPSPSSTIDTSPSASMPTPSSVLLAEKEAWYNPLATPPHSTAAPDDATGAANDITPRVRQFVTPPALADFSPPGSKLQSPDHIEGRRGSTSILVSDNRMPPPPLLALTPTTHAIERESATALTTYNQRDRPVDKDDFALHNVFELRKKGSKHRRSHNKRAARKSVVSDTPAVMCGTENDTESFSVLPSTASDSDEADSVDSEDEARNASAADEETNKLKLCRLGWSIVIALIFACAGLAVVTFSTFAIQSVTKSSAASRDSMQCVLDTANATFTAYYYNARFVTGVEYEDYIKTQNLLLHSAEVIDSCRSLVNSTLFFESREILVNNGLIALALIAKNRIDARSTTPDNADVVRAAFAMVADLKWQPFPQTFTLVETARPYLTQDQLLQWAPYSDSDSDLALPADDRTNLAIQTMLGPFGSSLMEIAVADYELLFKELCDLHSASVNGTTGTVYICCIVALTLFICALVTSFFTLGFARKSSTFFCLIVAFSLMCIAMIILEVMIAMKLNVYVAEEKVWLDGITVMSGEIWQVIRMLGYSIAFPFVGEDTILLRLIEFNSAASIQQMDRLVLPQPSSIDGTVHLGLAMFAMASRNTYMHYAWLSTICGIHGRGDISVYSNTPEVVDARWDMSEDSMYQNFVSLYPEDTFLTTYENDVINAATTADTLKLAKETIVGTMFRDLAIIAMTSQSAVVNHILMAYQNALMNSEIIWEKVQWVALAFAAASVVAIVSAIVVVGVLSVRSFSKTHQERIIYRAAFTGDVKRVFLCFAFIEAVVLALGIVCIFFSISNTSIIKVSQEVMAVQWMFNEVIAYAASLSAWTNYYTYLCACSRLSALLARTPDVYRNAYLTTKEAYKMRSNRNELLFGDTKPFTDFDVVSASMLRVSACADPTDPDGGNQYPSLLQLSVVMDILRSIVYLPTDVSLQSGALLPYLEDAFSRMGSMQYRFYSTTDQTLQYLRDEVEIYYIIVGVALGVCFIVTVLMYFCCLRRISIKVKQQSVGTKLMLLSLPDDILNTVPEIKEFYDPEAGNSNDQMKRKMQQSERLLQNILPPNISRRLKNGERVIADAHQSVTVVFASLTGYEEYSHKLDAIQMVLFLNGIVVAFDHIVDLLELEKIKTVGDIYFFCGGLTKKTERDHAVRCVECSLFFFQALADHNSRHSTPNIKLRVGINTDPAVAGVIGNRKVAYDLWGDSVNTASRMYSTGVPGRIQVSDSTYKKVQSYYAFEDRHVQAKGKGTMLTHLYVERIKSTAYTDINWRVAN